MSHQGLIFEPLPMRRRARVPVGANQYYVRMASGEVKQVEASTAYEAFKISGVQSAMSIERATNVINVVLDRTKFSDSDMFDMMAMGMPSAPEEAPLASLTRRKCPVVPADELDMLMRKLQASAMQEQEKGAMSVPFPASEPVPAANVEGSVNLTGTEVHGDGFDELIPSPMPGKPSVLTYPAEPKEEAVKAESPVPAVPVEEPPPAQELSQEEIEKLLNGQ